MDLFFPKKVILREGAIEVFNKRNMRQEFTYIDNIVKRVGVCEVQYPRRQVWAGHETNLKQEPYAPWKKSNIDN